MFNTDATLTYVKGKTKKLINFEFLTQFNKPRFDGADEFLCGLLKRMPELRENINEKFYKNIISERYTNYVEEESLKFINFFIVNRLLAYLEQDNNQLIVINTFDEYDTKTIFAVDYLRKTINVFLQSDVYFFDGVSCEQIKKDISEFMIEMNDVECIVGNNKYQIKFNTYCNDIEKIKNLTMSGDFGFADLINFNINDKVKLIKKISNTIKGYIKNRDNYSEKTYFKFCVVSDNSYGKINEKNKHDVWEIFYSNKTNPNCDYIVRRADKIYKPCDYRFDFLEDDDMINLYNQNSNSFFREDYSKFPKNTFPTLDKILNNPEYQIKKVTKIFLTCDYDIHILHSFLRIIENIIYNNGKRVMWDNDLPDKDYYGNPNKRNTILLIKETLTLMQSLYNSLFVLNNYYDIINKINDYRHAKLLLDVLNNIEIDILNVLISLNINDKKNIDLIKKQYRIKYNSSYEGSWGVFKGLSDKIIEYDFNESYRMSYFDQLLRLDKTNSSVYLRNLKKIKQNKN